MEVTGLSCALSRLTSFTHAVCSGEHPTEKGASNGAQEHQDARGLTPRWAGGGRGEHQRHHRRQTRHRAGLRHPRAARRRPAHDAAGLDLSLLQVFENKHLLSPDQAQDLRHAAAVETGEALKVGSYEVMAKIGQGGFGTVFKARKLDSGELVALKILLPSLTTQEHMDRFERESELVRKLDHRNIVSCVEFGRDPKKKCWFCALEYVEGEDLAKKIAREGVLSEDEALSITYQIAQALQHAHWSGLVHRDVKPENIMVTPDGTAKLLDLGLARPANAEATRLTETGMFVGSAYYASPEQAKSESAIDTRSDIYSLGATLYHMVTGNPPFQGSNAAYILYQQAYEKLTWPAEVNPDLSDGTCRVIAKMLAKAPAERYQLPKDLLRDIDKLREGGVPDVADAALRNSSVAVALREGGGELRLAPPPSELRPKRKRRRLPSSPRLKRQRPASHPRLGRAKEDVPGEEPTRARLPRQGRPLLKWVLLGLGAGVFLIALMEVLARLGREPVDPPAPPAVTGQAGPTLDLGPGVKMEFVRIEPGIFEMGSPASEAQRNSDEGPRHHVRITRAFYMGRCEVTQAQYRAVMGTDPSHFKGPALPVERVTWKDATEFCRRLTAKGRGTRTDSRAAESEHVPLLPPRFVVRLPTEAEWEYACRAGSAARFCFGDGVHGLGDHAWNRDNSRGHTHPVGRKKPNAWGLHDMHGNVWEWCADWYGKYPPGTPTDPVGPATGSARVLRGGCWSSYPLHCRSASRMKRPPGQLGRYHGFRVVASSSAPGHANRPKIVPPDAVEFGGHFYKLFSGRLSWHDANSLCEGKGGHLVTITSEAENDLVKQLVLASRTSVWIGLSDSRHEGRWEWVTGERSDFSAWALGGPSSDEYKNWAQMRHAGGCLWEGTRHDIPGIGLVCEWEPGGPHAPTIVSRPAERVRVGSRFEYVVRATGDPVPKVEVTGLPDWLAFDGKETISGAPPLAAVGTRTELTVTASNGEGEDIQRFTVICESAGAPAPQAPAPGDGRRSGTAAEASETVATETRPGMRKKSEETIGRAWVDFEEAVDLVLAKFDASVSEGDYAEARRAMEAEARKPQNAVAVDALRAAARVAALLDGRKKTIRRKAQSLVDAGAQMTLVTRKAELKGKIVDSNTWGLKLIVTTSLPGGGEATRPAEVGWSELTRAQMETFTGDWPPEGADGHVARGIVLLLEGKKTAANKAFATAGVHPVAAYFLAREARAAAEEAAKAAWEAIKQAAAGELTPDESTAVSMRIAAFEKEHGDTRFAASVAEELARMIKSTASVELTGGCFGFRDQATRLAAALRNGGNRRSEASVDAGLRWLASNQEPDGSWDIEKWGGNTGWGKVGVTGLATLAFLGAGHTEDAGAHRASVIKAVNYLISQQNEMGAIGVSEGHWGYCHAIAGLALAEAYGMARAPRTGEAAQKAVIWSVEHHQKEYSGWRYTPKQSPDTSVTGWFIMQLKSAKIAGLKVDGKGFQGAIAWLDKVTNMPVEGADPDLCGTAGYTSRNATPSMTAVAMLGRQFMGWKRTDPLLVGGANYLVKTLPQWGQGGWSMYRWYHGTLAMFQMGGDWWKQWNAALRDMLVQNQIKLPDPKMDGSWDPSFSSGGKRAGRAYSTAMACLCLEVYYRYLPLYK